MIIDAEDNLVTLVKKWHDAEGDDKLAMLDELLTVDQEVNAFLRGAMCCAGKYDTVGESRRLPRGEGKT